MLDSNLSIIFGTFWTGKTYYAVRDAYKAYLNGSIVISNMWLAFPHVRWYQPSDLPSILHEIYDYHEQKITPFDAPDSFLMAHNISRSEEEPRSFYILADEGGVFFNSRNFASNFKEKSLLVMLAEPRHFNMQITAITQELDLIDKTFRDLSQEIIEFTPFLFWIFRRAISYDKNRMFSDKGGLREEIPIIDTKTYFHWWHRKKDTSNFFGGLYYTKEVLGDLALVRPSHIHSLKDFFEREDIERDWRETYSEKLGKFIKIWSWIPASLKEEAEEKLG